MTTLVKIFIFCIVVLAVAVLLWAVARNQPAPVKSSYSQFLQQVQSGKVVSATITSGYSDAHPVNYSLMDGTHAATVVPSDYRHALHAMQQNRVNVEINAPVAWKMFAANSAPFLILLAVWFFAYGQLRQRRAP